MSSLYSIGQMNEHADALERSGWTPADLKKASGGEILAHLLPLVRAYGEVGVATTTQRIIDCDAKPFEPSGLTVAPESEQLPNRVRGHLVFDPAKIKLHLSPNQLNGKYIKGEKLKTELASEPVLPANVLDFYLANPTFIPEELKGKAVFFWGTIYRDSHGNLYVRCLYFDDGRWVSFYYWLDCDWSSINPAALLAS